MEKILSLILSVIMLMSVMSALAQAIELAPEPLEDGSPYEEGMEFADLIRPQVLTDTYKWIESTKTGVYYESLEGLRVNLLGDSYLKGHTMQYAEQLVWPALLAYKYGWELNNFAQNGAPVSTATDITYADNMVNNLKKMPSNSPDLVIFDGGRNDWNKNVPLGDEKSRDDTTYMGALNVVIDGLKEKYPEAKLIYTTVWNYSGENGNGHTSQQFALAAKKVCDSRGVEVYLAVMPTVSGVDMSDASFRNQYCLDPSDVSHLNLAGMKLVMPKYEAFIFKALSKNVTPPDADIEVDTETDTDIEVDMDTDSDTEMDTEIDTEIVDIESDTEIDTECDIEIDTESETEIDTDSETEIDTEECTDTDTEADTEDTSESEKEKSFFAKMFDAIFGFFKGIIDWLFGKKE